jgi:hypothetical protein
LHDFRAQFHRHRGDNGLQGQLQFIGFSAGVAALWPPECVAAPAQPSPAAAGVEVRKRGVSRHDRFVVIRVAQQAPEQPGNFYFYTV